MARQVPPEEPLSGGPVSAGAPSEPRPFDEESKAPVSAKAEGELQTPAEHARATGNVESEAEALRIGGRPDERAIYSPAHRCAVRLHGWADHEYHAGEPIKITRAAYEAALKAAMQPVTRLVVEGKRGEPLDAVKAAEHTNSRDPKKVGELFTDYEPHEAALSKYAPNHPKASA
jgi:hypothetical protein